MRTPRVNHGQSVAALTVAHTRLRRPRSFLRDTPACATHSDMQGGTCAACAACAPAAAVAPAAQARPRTQARPCSHAPSMRAASKHAATRLAHGRPCSLTWWVCIGGCTRHTPHPQRASQSGCRHSPHKAANERCAGPSRRLWRLCMGPPVPVGISLCVRRLDTSWRNPGWLIGVTVRRHHVRG